MISMPLIESIREMSRSGLSNAEIQRRTGVSQPTIRKYLAMDDFSPKIPARRRGPSILDPYKPFVDGILDADLHVWRKQRHSAKRIFERLVAETDYPGGYGIVKIYVRERKTEMEAVADARLELVWAPGEAQADFGDVDVAVHGEVMRMHLFVLSFPFSNMGFVQLFGGETSECVCQGLADIFDHIGGVPHRIVFDNATGAGRRIGGKVTEAELFHRMKTHYGFSATYANPYSGHEKGNVERKVFWARQHLFTPMPHVDDIEVFNSALLAECDAAGSGGHYEKDATWSELFECDRAALIGPPAKPFSCVRISSASCDLRGDAALDGGHRYHAGDGLAGRRAVVAFAAHTVIFADDAGNIVSEHARRFGRPANGPDALSQLHQLWRKPGAWKNSALRALLPSDVSTHMDSLERKALSDLLRCMDGWCGANDVQTVIKALSGVLSATGRIHVNDVEMMIARMSGFGLGAAPEKGPDLHVYDTMLKGGDAA